MSLRNAFDSLATEAKLELVRALLESVDSKLHVNADDRLRVSTMPGRYDLVEGNITASAQTVSMNCENVSNIMLHCRVNPAATGHNSTFEGSLNSTDGVNGNWFAIQAVRTNANTVELTTGVLAATPAYGWELSVNAIRWVRVRATAHTGGTMTWMIQAGSYATEPIPAIQSHAVTLSSTTANIGTVAMTIYADSTANLGASATFTGTSRDAAAAPTWQRFIARAFSDQAGTLFVEDSTDGTAWRAVASVATVANICSTLDVPVLARYNRVKFVNGSVAQTAFRMTSGLQRI